MTWLGKLFFLLGLYLGHGVYQLLTDHQWEVLIERYFFQVTALALYWWVEARPR